MPISSQARQWDKGKGTGVEFGLGRRRPPDPKSLKSPPRDLEEQDDDIQILEVIDRESLDTPSTSKKRAAEDRDSDESASEKRARLSDRFTSRSKAGDEVEGPANGGARRKIRFDNEKANREKSKGDRSHPPITHFLKRNTEESNPKANCGNGSKNRVRTGKGATNGYLNKENKNKNGLLLKDKTLKSGNFRKNTTRRRDGIGEIDADRVDPPTCIPYIEGRKYGGVRRDAAINRKLAITKGDVRTQPLTPASSKSTNSSVDKSPKPRSGTPSPSLTKAIEHHTEKLRDLLRKKLLNSSMGGASQAEVRENIKANKGVLRRIRSKTTPGLSSNVPTALINKNIRAKNNVARRQHRATISVTSNIDDFIGERQDFHGGDEIDTELDKYMENLEKCVSTATDPEVDRRKRSLSNKSNEVDDVDIVPMSQVPQGLVPRPEAGKPTEGETRTGDQDDDGRKSLETTLAYESDSDSYSEAFAEHFANLYKSPEHSGANKATQPSKLKKLATLLARKPRNDQLR